MTLLAAANTPVAPPWVVLPLGFVAMVVVAAYILALLDPAAADSLGPARRRLRLTSAWVTMLTIPAAAYGFGIATPARPRVFVLIWTVVVAMLLGVLALAVIDLVGSMRWAAGLRRQRREDLRTTIDDIRRLAADRDRADRGRG
jgi:hypothetical protein